MEIIAHRGASHDAPENTLAAMNLAWQQGADAVEIDVQSSRTGRLMVFHDETTHRITGQPGRLRDLSVQQLRKLDAGAWKAPRWRGERIPKLAEAFDLLPPGKRLFVEIKGKIDCIPPFITDFKKSRLKPDAVVAIGFDQDALVSLKQALPKMEVCPVVKFHRSWKTGSWTPRPTDLISHINKTGLSGLDIGANGPVTTHFVHAVHRAGLTFYVWTVDAPAKATRMQAAGIDGLTTNRPGWMREKLGHS